MREAMTRLPATPPTVGTPPGLDWHDLQDARAHGRQLQAEAVAGFLARIARAPGFALRRLVRRRADRFALLSMNDHLLADIGLRRMDVQAIAYGVIPVEQVSASCERTPRSAEVTRLRARPAAQEPRPELDAAA